MMNKLRMLRMGVGIPQLAVGVLCFFSVSILTVYGIYPQEVSILYFQMGCMAAGFMSLLVGLESIAFPSQDKRGDRNSLIYDIVLSLCLAIVLIITGARFSSVYLGENVMNSETELWESSTIALYALCYTLSLISAILLFITLGPLGFLLYKNYKPAT